MLGILLTKSMKLVSALISIPALVTSFRMKHHATTLQTAFGMVMKDVWPILDVAYLEGSQMNALLAYLIVNILLY